MADITSEDRERVKLLSLISSSKNEFDKLSLEQLARLEELVKKKTTAMIKRLTKQNQNFLKELMLEFMK